MGGVQSLISQSSFTFMGGEAENNKNRLIETYNDYKKMIKEKGV